MIPFQCYLFVPGTLIIVIALDGPFPPVRDKTVRSRPGCRLCNFSGI